MQFAFTEEQDLIRDTARKFLAANAGSSQLRAAMTQSHAYDPDVWRAIAQELGWCGIGIPESMGGAGMGMVEQAILFEETGRCLLGTPLLATAGFAAAVLHETPESTERTELLAAIACGNRCLALVATDDSGIAERYAVNAVTLGGSLRLSGHGAFVLSGDAADSLIVPAVTADGDLVIAQVDLPAAGAVMRSQKALDLTRQYARIEFNDVVPSALLADGPQARRVWVRGVQVAQVALAAEQLGGAIGALELTTTYVKERHQFGRPIGSFQAIKHRLADMLVECEAGKSAVYYAACVVDEWRSGTGTEYELAQAAALVKSHCSDMFQNVAGNAIQLHGGIGFTWEYAAQLYFKRARASGNLLGTAQYHRERLAELIGLVTAAETTP